MGGSNVKNRTIAKRLPETVMFRHTRVKGWIKGEKTA